MEFRDYVLTILKTNFFHESQPRFIINLFRVAGAVMIPIEETAKSWIRPSKPQACTITDYFPDGTMYDNGFIGFISNRMGDSWKKLQDAFRLIKTRNDLVDVDTDIPEVFYWSLLNQFQRIHKLPLSEMASSLRVPNDILEKDKTLEEVASEQMLRYFRQAVDNHSIESTIKREPTDIDKVLGFDKDISSRVSGFISIIQSDIIKPFETYEKEMIYINIKRFSKELSEYNNFLMSNPPPQPRLTIKNPAFTTDNRIEVATDDAPSVEYGKIVDRYRQRLTSILNEIYGNE